MKQILWFRRDLRIKDNAILANAKGEVLPIFIFDKNILEKLNKDDKRVKFIYNSIKNLKEDLKSIGLDLKVFFDKPSSVFDGLKEDFDEVLCSCDFDNYAKKRDKEIEKIIPLKRYYDSYLLHPQEGLKADNTPYKVFTPFYKNLKFIWESDSLQESDIKNNLKNIKLFKTNYEDVPSLKEMGFHTDISLPNFLENSAYELLQEFKEKIKDYTVGRDYFYLNSTSSLGVHLRFGLISPRTVFNEIKKYNVNSEEKDFFIRELFWREFYNYILFHFPKSEFENLNQVEVNWNNNQEDFKAWCNGKTGVPLVDAAMRYFNETGTMHNRLRMIVSSYLTKNLLIDWKWGEEYFASKLLDYDASSNVGSWQWAASTGADSVPYFRVFNPYLQSKKFDKDGLFIKSVIPELKEIDAKLFHKENGVQEDIFLNYPKQVVSIDFSRKRCIEEFKRANNEKK